MTPTQSASASFAIEIWEETPLVDEDGLRMHSTHLTKRFTGDLEGTSAGDMLMLHVGGQPAAYCGFERVSGRLGTRTGSFVLHHDASAGVDGGLRLTVVPGSGTDELTGLAGSARIEVDGDVGEAAAAHRLVLEYRFD